MKVVMLGAPELVKERRQRKLQQSTIFLTSRQVIFSVRTSRTARSLGKRQKPTWTRAC